MKRPTPFVRPSSFVLACALFVGVANADEPAPAPAPTPHGEAPSVETPSTTPPVVEIQLVDLRDLHASLALQLERVIDMPAHTETDHGLYDIWEAAVRPRIARLKQTMGFLGEDRRFLIDTETHRALGVADDQWSPFVRDGAALHASLAGMLDAYLKANVKITSPFGLGIDEPAKRVTDDTPFSELGLFAYERELHRRLAARRPARGNDLLDYRNLAGRIRAELLRRSAANELDEQPEGSDILADAAARYDAAVRDQVDQIAVLLVGVRTFMAYAQSLEEESLHELVAEAEADDESAETFSTGLSAMRAGRLAALGSAWDDASNYGSLLRNGWLAPRRDVRRALGLPVEEFVDEPVESPAEPVVPRAE